MQQKEYLEISNKKIAHLLKQSINVISKIGELRDVYTAGHQNKVAELAIAIAREMELPDETIQNISYGALIHDIGKIYIPSDILNKPGKISNLEYQILQTHVERSYDVVKEIDFSPQIPMMIYQHHERLDGSGYPLGLTSDQIIIESRILAVADVVEAMSAHRPYRASLGIDAALVEISTNKGSKFDSDVVDICIKLFREQGFAFTCKLI
jgi:putative nucleotidyltransferase with HDIG domain